jgi:hypothetical protein
MPQNRLTDDRLPVLATTVPGEVSKTSNNE